MALREILAEFGVKFNDAELKRAEERLREATKKLDRFGHRAASTSRAAKGFAGSVGFTAGELNKFTRANDKAFDKLKKLGLAAAATGAALAGFAAKNIVQTGASYEQAISAVGAVGLQTRDQIAELDAKARELGSTTQFTATEAANAMEIMARAGFQNQEILSGVGGVLDAAAASGLTMEEVANHVSNALKGFGLEASQATHVADVLALASSKTNSTIGSLGEGLRNVAATARQLNVPFEDTVAAIAALQDVGLDASVAGSSLNTMLTKMAKPPKKVAEEMKKWGISFKDATGNMLPFQQVIQNVSEAAKKAGGNFDRVAFLADLVGLRGQKAAANLAHLFETGKLRELTAQLLDADGAAAKMAKLRLDNLLGDWTIFKSAVSDVEIELFNTQSGPMRDLVQETTKWVNANKGAIKQEFIDYLQFIRVHIDDIVTAFKVLGYSIAVWASLTAAVKLARAAMISYRAIVITVTALTKGFAAAKWVAVTATNALAAAQARQNAALLAGGGRLAGLRTGLNGVAGAAGAAAAAIGSIYLAYDQFNKLLKESGGWEGLKKGIGSFFSGKGYFAGANAELDKQARERAGVTLTPEQFQAEIDKQRRASKFGGRAAATTVLNRKEQNIQANDQRRQSVVVHVTQGGNPEDTGARVGRAVVKNLGNATSTDALEAALVPTAE